MMKSVQSEDNCAADLRDAETRARIRDELDKNFLVEAAAGTGKTTSIVNRLVSLVARGECEVGQLAAVTFTRKAAAELRERFQAELRKRVADQSASTSEECATRDRLLHASDNSGQAFVGTIHSFCASLLRERPIEFRVDPAFRELDAEEDAQLRELAWLENISDLIASNGPLIDKFDELGIDRQLLKQRFPSFIEQRDVSNWPHSAPAAIDIDALQQQTHKYVDRMRSLLPMFPAARGTDNLMARYEAIVRASGRAASGRSWSRLGDFFNFVELFDTSCNCVQKHWHDKAVAKSEKQFWEHFREAVAKPAMQYWCRVRYRFVVDFLRRAVAVYERMKLASSGLDFNDLLLICARGLKTQPELRKYFQTRYTHLLVDEFQDTDPIQAEMILYLTSADVSQQEWQKCTPRPGSLFVVGDPKQSIYRFRRGDIVTYNRVKEIFKTAGGEVLALVKNFRSRPELIEWTNRIFRDKFRQVADEYTPAAEDMVLGRQDAIFPNQQPLFFGSHRLLVDTSAGIDDATDQEADAIARFIRHAIDAGLQVPRTKRELEIGRTHAVEARDFLIIPWNKKRIGTFRTALQSYDVPCEVTGGNAFDTIPELALLIDCLRAIDDPQNPVHLLAVLRDVLFGFSDSDLYQFKQAGGRFVFTAPVPDRLEESLRCRFADAMERFKRYQSWMRSLPFTAAVTRVAEDLGLLASAAAGVEANVTVGGMLKALEWTRQHSFDFDSATDLISFFEGLLEVDETEGCTALPPDTNVVRVMNLHKAKGLESPIVFLAGTSEKYVHPVLCHIDRSGSEAIGYMGITAEKGRFARKDVATPENWQKFRELEQTFIAAEADRLLYVATTRAACATIVSVGKEDSNWSGLHRYLSDAPVLEVPTDQQLNDPSKNRSAKQPTRFNSVTPDQVERKWTSAMHSNYAIATAKQFGLKGSRRPRWETTGEYGYKWGSAVHELLEIHTKSPKADLRSWAMTLASEYDLAFERVDELLTTVDSVTKSDLWRRAQQATRCFSELPFETLVDVGGVPTILRGVIDLIFEETQTASESAGWVIVDYKTDDITASDIAEAVSYYKSQLHEYARRWSETTGLRTKEVGLYFTKLNLYKTKF